MDVYSSSGRIDLRQISLPGPHPNLPGLQQLFNEKRKELKRLDELIPYNDCLYTNMYRYLFTLKPWLECTMKNSGSLYWYLMNCCMVFIRIPSRYKWIGLLDVDEVLVPRKLDSLAETMDVIESKDEEEDEGHTSWSFIVFSIPFTVIILNIISRSFSNVYFLDNMTDESEVKDNKEIPPNLHILNHVYRFITTVN